MIALYDESFLSGKRLRGPLHPYFITLAGRTGSTLQAGSLAKLPAKSCLVYEGNCCAAYVNVQTLTVPSLSS